MKLVVLLLSIITFSVQTFGEENVDLFQETLDKFEKNCIDQNNNLREDVFVSDEMYSCKKELEYLKYEFERRENLMSQNEEVYEQYKNCIEKRNNPKVSKLAEFGEAVSEELSCNEVDKAKHEKECSTAMQCNALRSVLDGIDILPRALERPVKKFVRKEAKKKGYSDECMSDDKSNCLEDFTNALIDNLWSSATSILSLAKSGFTSLFNMTGLFDKQADKALTAMNQSKEDVASFMDSPGKWMVNFYNNLVAGVQHWIKSSVFCQKWLYNDEIEERGGSKGANSNTLRTCVEPLEDFSCIDCDDVINATCVGLGALTAELGVAFFTAGAGTVASFTSKASAKALAVASSKAGSKIKSISPKLAKASKKTKKKPSKVSAYATKMAENAKLAISVTSAQAMRVKGKIDNINDAVRNTKVVRVTSEVIEKVNFPARISEKVGESATVLVAKGASKVAGKTGAKAVKKEADLIVKASSKSHKSARARDFLDENNHGKKRVVSHTSKGGKVYSKGESINRSSTTHKPSSPDRGVNKGSGSGRDGKYGNGEGTTQVVSETKKGGGPTQKVEPQIKPDGKKSSSPNSKEEKRRLAEKRERERIEKEKQNKLAQEKQQQQEQEEKKKKLIKTAIAGVAADLTAKGINVSKEQAERELEQLDRYSKGESAPEAKTLKSAKEVLGVDGKSVFSQSTLASAQNVKDMYADENKESIIDRMMESDPSMSRGQAENAFNQRKESVNQAYDYINNTVSSATTSTSRTPSAREKQISQLENELQKVKSEGEISSINSELDELKKERERLESSNSASNVVSSNENISTENPSDFVSSGGSSSSSNTVAVEKPSARRSGSSIASGSSVQSTSNSNTGDSGYAQTSTSSASSIDSLDSAEMDPTLAQIDSLHEALEEVSPEVEQELAEGTKEEEVEKVEPEQRKKSKNLKEILGLISKKGMVVENNSPIKEDLSSVLASDKDGQRKLKELIEFREKGLMADKLVTYQIEDGKLRVYHFGNSTYPIATSDEGISSLVNENVSKSLIERAIGQVE